MEYEHNLFINHPDQIFKLTSEYFGVESQYMDLYIHPPNASFAFLGIPAAFGQLQTVGQVCRQRSCITVVILKALFQLFMFRVKKMVFWYV